jgi:hypothetical protein
MRRPTWRTAVRAFASDNTGERAEQAELAADVGALVWSEAGWGGDSERLMGLDHSARGSPRHVPCPSFGRFLRLRLVGCRAAAGADRPPEWAHNPQAIQGIARQLTLTSA